MRAGGRKAEFDMRTDAAAGLVALEDTPDISDFSSNPRSLNGIEDVFHIRFC
jgi:hypothetical protein